MKSLEFYAFLITEESHSASKLRKKLGRRPPQLPTLQLLTCHMCWMSNLGGWNGAVSSRWLMIEFAFIQPFPWKWKRKIDMQLKKISRIAQHTAKNIIRIENETQNKLQDKEEQTKKLKLAGWYVVQVWSWRTSVALRQPHTDLVRGCTCTGSL